MRCHWSSGLTAHQSFPPSPDHSDGNTCAQWTSELLYMFPHTKKGLLPLLPLDLNLIIWGYNYCNYLMTIREQSETGIARNIYLGLCLSCWHRASKTLGISWMTGVIGTACIVHNKPPSTIPEFMLIRWLLAQFLESCRIRASLYTDQGKIKGLDLSAPPLDPQKGRGAADWVNYQWSMM